MTGTSRTVIVLVATVVLTLSGGPSALTFTGGGRGGDDEGAGWPARASAAALGATGGGRVTGAEVGDEESRYEVEVTLPDGRQVDVQLDETFTVVGGSAEIEEPDGPTG